jgi:hypothetical protein
MGSQETTEVNPVVALALVSTAITVLSFGSGFIFSAAAIFCGIYMCVGAMRDE